MDKPLSPHWADQAAFRLVKAKGDQQDFTVASGVTPSGTVHIGNFRECITVDFVARAIRDLGKKVRCLHSWDDFDTFRKVPKNLPQQEMLAKQLRRPIARVPDAYGIDASYARHNARVFEEELAQVGVKPEFINQHERYQDGAYAEQIRFALQRRKEIAAILNQYRSEPLADDWLPTAIYCEVCDRDEMAYEKYDGDWGYSYKCTSCGHEATTNIKTTRNLKLQWRTDWPMRWAFEKVDFEPGGKDHSSEGGSFDTGSKIVKAIWERDAPQYLQYDFVTKKGGTGKMSSSSGDLFTLSDAYEVYEPQMVRWIFASQRPNTDFAIAFDIDVIKIYDEFDRSEAQALGPAPEPAGKWPLLRRTYELSCVGPIPSEAPYRAPFRELCTRLQINDFDVKRTMDKYYGSFMKTEADRMAFALRCSKATNWLERHAPDEFKYRINKTKPTRAWSADEQNILAKTRAVVESTDLEAIDPKDLNQKIYDAVVNGASWDSKVAFSTIYQCLINRDQGPRLPGFLKELGKERVLALL